MGKYAIAIRDSGELFLMFLIRRGVKGDVYVNFNKRDSKHKPHSSYHLSGQLHHKSYNKILLPVTKKQSPTQNFRGSEAIIATSIQRGDGRTWNIPCKKKDFSEIMEIPDEIITPKFGYQLIVELVEAGSLPETSKSKYTRIIKQHFFKKGNPWIVASLCEVSASFT